MKRREPEGVPRVQFRVTPEQRRELEAEARASKSTVGDVARLRIFPPPARGRPAAPARLVQGFVRGVAPVVFRVSKEQRELLEATAARRKTDANDLARELCFPRKRKAGGGR